MKLLALPAFDDNYIWMLHDGQQAIVVDPGDAMPVLSALDEQALQLAAILVTHHHGDHIGGLDDLLAQWPGVQVAGPVDDRIGQIHQAVRDGDVLDLLGLRWRVIETPGHTRSHIAYFTEAVIDESSRTDIPQSLLFCGDTLFSGGCGRIFEGSPAQLHGSLSRLASLPPQTWVCSAHEYTLSNLKFARAVEPANADVQVHEERCRQWRAQGRPTLPSTIELEVRINPFLRCSEVSVAEAARHRDPAADTAEAVFTVIRQWKNEYR